MCYSLVNYITGVFHCDAFNLKFYILVILYCKNVAHKFITCQGF